MSIYLTPTSARPLGLLLLRFQVSVTARAAKAKAKLAEN